VTSTGLLGSDPAKLRFENQKAAKPKKASFMI